MSRIFFLLFTQNVLNKNDKHVLLAKISLPHQGLLKTYLVFQFYR